METTSSGRHGTIVLIPRPSNDPRDPLNWSLKKKYGTLAVICFSAIAATTAPNAHQLAYVLIAPLYNRSAIELSYTVTASVAGHFIGPLVFTPLARIIGRSSLIFWCLLATLLCQIWAAKMTHEHDYAPFLVSRVFAGIFASVPTIFGPAYAVDMFFLHQRGKAFVCYELSLLGGITATPTIGGFIVQSNPWPYTFWWTIGPIGLAMILVFFFLEETGFRRSLEDETRITPPTSFLKNRMATFFPGNKVVYQTCPREIKSVAVAPFILALSPVVIIVGLWTFMSFGFSAMINILLAVFLQTPTARGGYGFSPSQNAAFSFDAWLGIIVAQVVGWSVGDRIPLWVSRRFGHGIWRPEYRLWNIVLPSVVSPIGLGIFGAALQHHLHYMVLALGLFLVVFAATLGVPVCMNYATECFLTSPNELSVAMNMYRLSLTISLGFFIFPWERAVGVGWVFGMAAIFEIAMSIVVVLLAWKGKALRGISPKWRLDTEDGKRVEITEGESCGEEVLERKVVESPD